MTFYKTIKFEDVDLITKKLQNHWSKFLSSDKIDMEAFYNHNLKEIAPELAEQFIEKKLNFDIGKVFVTPANVCLPIHIDGSKEHPKDIALNWPLFNTDKSTMNWYKIINHNHCYATDARYGLQTEIYEEANLELLDSFIITEPTLVKIGLPHGVKNYANATRVILSFRFKPEPYHIWDGV